MARSLLKLAVAHQDYHTLGHVFMEIHRVVVSAKKHFDSHTGLIITIQIFSLHTSLLPLHRIMNFVK